MSLTIVTKKENTGTSNDDHLLTRSNIIAGNVFSFQMVFLYLSDDLYANLKLTLAYVDSTPPINSHPTQTQTHIQSYTQRQTNTDTRRHT